MRPEYEHADGFITMVECGGEYYILVYEKSRWKEACRSIASWASNPELTFNWYDAAKMSHDVRKSCKKK